MDVGFLQGVLHKIWNVIKKLTFTASGNLGVAINEDNVGLAKESTLSAIKNKIEDEIDTLGWVRVWAWDSSNNQWVYVEGKFNGRSYTYDSNGNLTQIAITIAKPDGTSVTVKKTFTYDTNGNLASESAWTI